MHGLSYEFQTVLVHVTDDQTSPFTQLGGRFLFSGLTFMIILGSIKISYLKFLSGSRSPLSLKSMNTNLQTYRTPAVYCTQILI
jgi:hypothetical protein